jgi:hypothetical protein
MADEISCGLHAQPRRKLLCAARLLPLPYSDPIPAPPISQGKNPQYRFMDRLFGYMNPCPSSLTAAGLFRYLPPLYFAKRNGTARMTA